MKPLVSILIPAYNSAEWIADTLRSALSQTWENKEIIVVDDGSKDDTFAIASRFQPDGVRVVRQENKGGPAARNAAFSLSNGDYIQWLDHDDLLAPDKISLQMAALPRCHSSRTLLSGEWGKFMYRPHRAEFTPTALWADLSPSEFLLRKLGQNVYMQTSVWLVSRALSEAAGPWDTSMLTDDDGEYFCRILRESDGICFVQGAKVYYRISGTGQGSYMGRSDRKMEAKLRAIKIHIESLCSLEESARARAACVQYLQDWLIFFYPERLDIVDQAKQMARDLGGELKIPRLSWKYRWIQDAFGWELAKRAWSFLPNLRWSCARHWDRALAQIERRGFAGRPSS